MSSHPPQPFAIALASFFALGCGHDAAGAVDPRPNVLVLISDDQAVDTLGCEGHPWSLTPAIDRLAASGARFTQACVTTSLCSPSRASLLTGLYARRHGVLGNETPLPDEAETFASRMTEAGYDSAYVGKWHMGEEPGPRPGFRWSATIAGQGSYRVNDFRIGDAHAFRDEQLVGAIDDVSTGIAIEFLRRERRGPFLLVVGFKGPHRPHRPANRHEDLYAAAETKPPANADAFPPFPMHHELEPLAEAAGVPVAELTVPELWSDGTTERDPEQWTGKKVEPAERVRDYYRVIHGIDENVDRLVATLRDMGVLRDTLIVYTSDNGMCMGSHGLIGKHTTYEESVRVPMIVSYPAAFVGGTVLDEPVLNVDLAPTLLDYAGLTAGDELQGRSLRPLLEGLEPAPPWRTEAVFETSDPDSPLPTSVALRSSRWKLIVYPGRDSWTELFDLASDPGERVNLAHDRAHAAQLAGMLARLEQAERELGPRAAPGR